MPKKTRKPKRTHVERYPLDDIASVLQVHPRTVARRVDVPWVPRSNPAVELATVASELGCDARALRHALCGRDELLTPAGAALLMDLSIRTMRHRELRGKFPVAALIRVGSIVRYSRRALLAHIERSKPQPTPAVAPMAPAPVGECAP